MRILDNINNWIARVIRTRAKRVIALFLVLVMATAGIFAVTGNIGDIGRNNTSEGFINYNDFPVEDVAFANDYASGDFVTAGYFGHGYDKIKDIHFYVTVARGQSIESMLPEDPEISGFSFTHWSLMPNGVPFNFSQPLFEDTTFYAIWLAGDEYTYDVYDDYYGNYVNDAPYFLHDVGEYFDAQGHGYDIGHSYVGRQDINNPSYDEWSGYNYTYDYGHDYYNAYDNGNSFYYDYSYASVYANAFVHDGDVYSDIAQAPFHLYSGYTNNEGPYSAHGLYDAYSHEQAYSYGNDYNNYYRDDSSNHNNYVYDYGYDSSNYNDYAYGYDDIHDYGEYGYGHEPQYLAAYTSAVSCIYGDTITVMFRINFGGQLDPHFVFYHDGEVNIDVDARGNISVYPEILHAVILDGPYIHVRFPMEISLGNISVGMTNRIWAFELSHLDYFEAASEFGEDGEGIPVEARTHTNVTISHDILETFAQPGEAVTLYADEQDIGFGFMPFASRPPLNFNMVTLQFPFDNAAWLTAVNDPLLTENRVVVVPQDHDFLSVVNIQGNVSRHVIITTQGTDLNYSLNTHTFTGTPAVLTYTGTSGRHFTVSNNVTLTLSHIVLDGNVIFPSTAFNRGGITIAAGGSLHMLSGSTIQHSRFNGGGGVQAQGATGVFTMSGDSRIYRNATGSAVHGGGVQITGARTFTMSDSASISHNNAMHTGGGVALSASGAHLIINDNSSISHNLASDTQGHGMSNGGGVALTASGALLTMNGGSIDNNTAMGGPQWGNPAIGNGGGVHVFGADSNFTFNGGSIHSNHAAQMGGGIFASLHTYSHYFLGTGHFPQLYIQAAAIFSGNTAGGGSFAPPVSVHQHTNIAITDGITGGYEHPLNNLDINFFLVVGDWLRLNSAIVGTSATNIVIHPRDSSVASGLSGATYNLVISDPGDGYTITTFPLSGGTTAHAINVARPVTISAVADSDIVIRMPLPGAPNTPNIAPWTTASAELERHFIIGQSGTLTLGGGTGSGTLTLDGNAALNTGTARRRGGILVNANGGFILQSGGVIYNSASHFGGGVELNAATATFNMTGGSITNNRAMDLNTGWGSNGGGVALRVAGAQFTMSGGTISGNRAYPNTWVALSGNGGGVFLVAGAASNFTFSGGSIINNHAYAAGGGIFAGTYTYAATLPAGAFPQLNIGTAAIFGGNTSSLGGFTPPTNPGPPTTNITAAASRSGGFLHPINNLDINFVLSDWFRLNNVIATVPLATNIVIHPAGAGVPAGLQGAGPNYNFIISPGRGSVINTTPISGAPVGDTHRINVLRTVTIGAAPGANIVLDMSAPFPDAMPNVGRHFQVGGNGHLTLGGGAGSGTLTLNGNASTFATGNRGGVNVNVGTGSLTMAVGGTITNSRAVNGGGVLLSAGSVGVNPHLIMTGGSITNNFATSNGGGVALTLNNTRATMNSGTISGNTAASNGGGVHLAAGLDSRFHFNGGAIQNNTASMGGGIFTSEFLYADPLPSGTHFPQLTVSLIAIFTGNIATVGGFMPPGDAATYTGITNAAQRSGTFGHPLNNLDINFLNPSADWLRLNYVINTLTPAPARIIIHPAGVGAIEGPVGPPGTDFNFVISDSGATNTISTLPVAGTAHSIAISNRTVTIEARTNSDIILSMPAVGGRHFNVSAGGVLTLSGGQGGTLALQGNRVTGQIVTRGGIDVTGNGILNLYGGSILRSNQSSDVGGGVSINNTGIVNMFDGSLVTDNVADSASTMGGGGGLGFSANFIFAATINMFGGTVSYNTAVFGGGIWAMSGTVNMYGGYIINNNAGIIGTIAPNSGALDGTIANPHGAGGGVRVCCQGNLFMHYGTIKGNTARYGGGVLLSHGTAVDDPITSLFVMYGGHILNNTASLAYVNPLNQRPGWVHNEDGGGVFIMSSGEFIMRDHPDEVRPITISGNTAGQHGGGVFWQVGSWCAYDRRTQPVIMEDNNAVYDGGAIFLSFRTLDMYGTWQIGHNSANRGGGIFLHGDNSPHTYHPVYGWLPHPLMGYGRLVMHDEGIRIHNNESATSGGGIYIFRDAILEMDDGSIDNNRSAIFGGGVYVLNPGLYFTSRFYVRGGRITRNRAIYGGGVYLMFRAHMYADDVLFAGNVAYRMGGAIFTELVDYGYMLSGEEVPHEILTPTPPDPNEIFYAFTNINLSDTVRFGDTNCNLTDYGINVAETGAFHSPYNAIDMLPNVRWLNWNTMAHEHLSIHIHPFNNYDVNYVRPVYFYKTDMEIYSTPASINNLPGAVFALDIEVPDPNNPGQYIWQFYTQATSEANGRVALFVFTPGRFRLREVTPPTGLYILPPGHWYLNMALRQFVINVPGSPSIYYYLLYIIDPPPYPCPNNTEFFFVRLDRENAATEDCEDAVEARMRWHVGNAPPRVALYLHKTGYEIFGMSPAPTHVNQLTSMLRPNAIFVLYRYLGDGTPDDTLVPAPGWVRTYGYHVSTGNANQPIELIRLAFREDQSYSYYQLVELVPPVGYMTHFGQWRVRMDVVDLPLNEVTMTVSTQGYATPNFVHLTAHYTADGDHVFAVGNMRAFELPLTGGDGSRGVILVMAAGMVFALLGIMGIGYLVVSKARKQSRFAVAHKMNNLKD